MKQIMSLIVSMMLMQGSYADITVSDVEVFSGYPWKEVVIGYTIMGSDDSADAIRLMATDKEAKQSYYVETGMSSLSGASLSEGRHVLRWNAAGDGVRLSTRVVFAVSVMKVGGVQLWENGPYWAECNVGATKPEEYGYYFWWGDTVGYKRVDSSWDAVDGSKIGFSFFNFNGNFPTDDKDNATLRSQGYIDATGNLVAKYDAATKHLGVPWRMPTAAEWNALISNCTTTWTTRNNVYGRLVTGKGAYASKSIFLPATGYGLGPYLYDVGSHGNYWSSTPFSSISDDALFLFFNSGEFYRNAYYRECGQSVRPLRGLSK